MKTTTKKRNDRFLKKVRFFKTLAFKNDRFSKRSLLKTIVYIKFVVSLTIVNDEPSLMIVTDEPSLTIVNDDPSLTTTPFLKIVNEERKPT